jgi:hypothetical protein
LSFCIVTTCYDPWPCGIVVCCGSLPLPCVVTTHYGALPSTCVVVARCGLSLFTLHCCFVIPHHF